MDEGTLGQRYRRGWAQLETTAGVEPAQSADVDREVLWERINFLSISQNKLARWDGVSSDYLSQVMSSRRSPSPDMLKRPHGALFQRTVAVERVVPLR